MVEKRGILRNFAKFTGNHLRESLFFNEVASLRSVSLFEKKFHVFFCEFCKIFKNIVFTEHLQATFSNISQERISSAAARYPTTASDHFIIFPITFQSFIFLLEAICYSLCDMLLKI